MRSQRRQRANPDGDATAGSYSSDESTEEADRNQHNWLRLLVSLIGVAFLGYGMIYAALARNILGLEICAAAVIAGVVLVYLGGLQGRGAQAVREAEYPSQPDEYSGD